MMYPAVVSTDSQYDNQTQLALSRDILHVNLRSIAADDDISMAGAIGVTPFLLKLIHVVLDKR